MLLAGQPRHSAQNSPEAWRYLEESFALSRQAALRSRCCLNVPYGDSPDLALDVFQPAPQGDRVPVLLFLHGGGFVSGSKENVGLLAPAVTHLPAVLVTPSYRLAPTVTRLDQVADCVAALLWTFQHIDRFGGDPQRIFVGGHSAGGSLAIYLALGRANGCRLEIPGGLVKGCFPVSAPLEREWVGPKPAGRLPPFFLTWGEQDIPPVLQGNPLFAQWLESCGTDVGTSILDGLNHFEVALAQGRPGNLWLKGIAQRIWPRSEVQL